MDDHDLARWRLRSQHLVAPHAVTAPAVVASLLAVQAENPGQSGWAVAARSEDPTPACLADALAEGTVLRTHVLRPTWHFVTADDLGWLLDLTGPRVRRITGQQLRVTHGLDDATVETLTSTVTQTLREQGELTRRQLAEALEDRGLRPSSQVLTTLLAHVELDGLLCSGRPAGTGSEHTYALLADRVPTPRRLARDEALAELALRYVTGHGPATERDLAYWATLTLTDARSGLAAVRDRLDRFDHDGRVFWHLAGQEPTPSGEPRGHLLQILDETYRGYQDSRWVLDAAGVVPRTRESTLGMALVDAQIVAAVRRTLRGGRVDFALQPYRALDTDDLAALRGAAERYGEHLGLEATLSAP